LQTKRIALIAVLSALTIVIAYARGISLALPGVVEFMTVMIFVSGFCFGWIVGGLVGFISLVLYMLIPSPFASPAAWIFSISPVLLLIMGLLGLMYGIVGGFLGKLHNPGKMTGKVTGKMTIKFIAEMAFWGFILTFSYDVLSSIGFYLAYAGIYPSVWDAIYMTFVPAYLPYPPIIHTVTNTFVFLTVAPALIFAIRALPAQWKTTDKKPSDP
jgi:hypothetical protein